MTIAARDDEDEALPWLEPAEADYEQDSGRSFPYRTVIIAAILISAIVALLWYVALRFGSDDPGDELAGGDVPLIEAPDSPYKERPDDPGGLDVEADRLTHAVAEGVVPEGQIAIDAAPEEPLPLPAPSQRTAPSMPAADMPSTVLTTRPASPPDSKPAAKPDAKPVASAALPPAKPADAAATKRPPTPQQKEPRPVAVTPATPKPVVVDKPVPAPVKAPAKASGGSLRVQLGAFSSTDIANGVWSKLSARVPALAGLAKSVEPVSSGGSTLYRLRAGGVAGETEANALCAAVRAAGEQCAVVR